MPITGWGIASALAAGAALWIARAHDPAAARRRAVLGDPAPDRLPWRARLAARLVPPSQAHRLAVIGMEPAQYAQQLGTGALFAAAALGILTRNPLLFLVGAGLGMGYQWLRVAGRHARWQRDVGEAVPDLVRMLQLRLKAGESVPRAVERVAPYLRGALQTEWERMLAEQASGITLDEALKHLDRRIADRHLTAVISRVRTYHQKGPPEFPQQPFGDMADHITKITMVQHRK